VKLPEFWLENSAAWFALAESRFRMKNIYDEWVRYDHVVYALSWDSLRLVLNLVTSPPEDEPYTSIKESLQSSHQLTDYQRIEQLLAMDALGSRRPSELLAHMLELCPTREETSKFLPSSTSTASPRNCGLCWARTTTRRCSSLPRRPIACGHYTGIASTAQWPPSP
jgi:hypothetical protein